MRLRNYRGVTDSEVRLPDSGVTIVEGPNEVGKSSIAEAIDLALTTLDSSTSRKVKATQPVQLDVGTEVEVEVSSGPYRFVLLKQWHRGRRTELEIIEPTREQLRGREAHERVEEMLAETLDTDLWAALRLTQGAELTSVPFDVPALGRALDLAAGGETVGDREGDLWERICAERDRYWTPTGLPRGERTAMLAALESVGVEVDAIATQLRELTDATDEVARLTIEQRDVESSCVDMARAEAVLVARADAVAAKRAELRVLEADATIARLDRDAAAGAMELRAGLIVAAETGAGAVVEVETELEDTVPEIALAGERDAESRCKLAAAREMLASLEAAHQRATNDRDFRRQEIELAQLTERRDRVRAAEVRLVAAEAVLDTSAVDDALAERIELAELEVARADAASRAAGATIRATAIGPVVIETDGRVVSLGAGEIDDIEVGESLALTLPGLVRFDVHAGLDARAFADQARVARASFDKLCREGGVAGRAEARQAAAARHEAERSRSHAVAAISDNLRDLTLDLIVAKVDGLGRRIDRYRATRGAEPPVPDTLTDAQAIAASTERELAALRETSQRLELMAHGAASQFREVQLDHAGLAARSEQVRAAHHAALEALASARAGVSDAALESLVRTAEHTLAEAISTYRHADRELAADDPDELDLLVTNAAAATERAGERLRANIERRRELQVLLDVRGEQGLQERHDAALTRREHLARDHRRTEARADAAMLLHAAFTERRAEARLRYVAPFRDRIQQLGRIVFGPTFEVTLSDDLSIATRTLDGITLDVDHLSVGAREQLGIIGRLACAGIVSGDGGAPVILDDALGWTDPRRLETMGAAIAVAGRDCQVIVLTCSPGRYAGVGSANAVTLGTSGN